MGIYEDKIREAIKKQYGSVPRMSLATGIPATTIYHALDRGMDNTTTRTRYMIIESLFIDDSDVLGGHKSNSDKLTDDEKELIDIWRKITPAGQQQLMIAARGCLSTFPQDTEIRGLEETA